MNIRDIYDSLREEDRRRTGLFHHGGEYPWSTCPTDDDPDCGVSNEHAEKILCWTMVEAMAQVHGCICLTGGSVFLRQFGPDFNIDNASPITALHAAYTATFPKEKA